MADAFRVDPNEDSIMAKDVAREIRRAMRRKFSTEEKTRIVLEGLRVEIPVTEPCRRVFVYTTEVIGDISNKLLPPAGFEPTTPGLGILSANPAHTCTQTQNPEYKNDARHLSVHYNAPNFTKTRGMGHSLGHTPYA